MKIEIYGKVPSEFGIKYQLEKETILLADIDAEGIYQGLQQFMGDLVYDQRIKNGEKGWKSPYYGTEITKILIKD